MALKVHHTQNKLAASLGLTIDATGVTYIIRNAAGAVVADTENLKEALGVLVKGTPLVAGRAKFPKAAKSKKVRKATKSKRRAAKSDDEGGDEEDEEPEPSSVVKAKYKAIYAKSELKGTNDDAFAVAFRAATMNEDDELDMGLVHRVARANKVDMSNYKTSGRGWQGRQRMTLGNILRGHVRQGTDVEIGAKTFKGAKVEPKIRKSRAKAK